MPRGCYWPTLEQVLRRQRLIDQMMETCAVDALSVVRKDGGLAFLEARTKCRYCLHENACREWLRFTTDAERAPAFCPNAEFFASCRREFDLAELRQEHLVDGLLIDQR
jgi:hypothetical protein